MRLINFRIPAAIVGFVPATIVGFALIASAPIEPARAAAIELYDDVPGGNPLNGSNTLLASSNAKVGGRVNLPPNAKKPSYIRIQRGAWEVCDGPDLSGICLKLFKGNFDLTKKGFNDKILSFRRFR